MTAATPSLLPAPFRVNKGTMIFLFPGENAGNSQRTTSEKRLLPLKCKEGLPL